MSDASARRQAMGTTDSSNSSAQPAPAPAVRQLLELSREDALALLASVRIGRIVFTRKALPAIRPVNHVIDDGLIIVRTHGDSALARQTGGSGIGGVVVAYEADHFDTDTHEGWSVVVTGYARQITDPGQLNRYQSLLAPWVDTGMDQAITIRPDMVSGFRLG